MNRDQFLTFYQRLEKTRTNFTECVKLTREDGTVFRFTAHDDDILVEEQNGSSYIYKSADSFKITAIENQIGIAVSNMDIDAIISDDSISEADLTSGLFNGANVELFLAYWTVNGLGILPLRTSWIGELTVKGVSFKADLRGIAQKLQQMFIHSCSLECRWIFGDSKCGKDTNIYTRDRLVTAVESRSTFSANIVTLDEGKFQWGLVTFLSGGNQGLSMEIIRNHEKRLQLFLPLPYDISVGDQIRLVYGCDKTYAKCRDFYTNASRFGGEPFLTGSDFIKTYPVTVKAEDEDSDSGKF